jgi:hypothetical protein
MQNREYFNESTARWQEDLQIDLSHITPSNIDQQLITQYRTDGMVLLRDDWLQVLWKNI